MHPGHTRRSDFNLEIILCFVMFEFARTSRRRSRHGPKMVYKWHKTPIRESHFLKVLKKGNDDAFLYPRYL